MIYRFGDFALDTELYELRCDSEPIALEPRVLEALAHLVAQRHRVVSKEELVEEVWGGQFVSDSAISRAIREIRRALGDTAKDSRWVKTVYGRGFAFVGQVREIGTGGVEGGAEAALESAADEDDPPLGPPLDETDSGTSRITPLPAPLTALIGRQREMRELEVLLADSRLVTLTGAGGAGKTRLALEAARRVAPRFRDGGVFVALGEITQPALVAAAIARGLGTGDAAGRSAEEAIRDHIGTRELLLLLDNFEQVVEARVVVADLLAACPGLVILVTSRFLLQVEGEREYPVPPLDLPPADGSNDELHESSSVALFLERARAVRRDFDPGDDDLAYVVEICRRLDGLPLAIELAAARVKILDPRELWQRLAERSDLLSAPEAAKPRRHRTLELALSWSYDLLGRDEQGLLQDLSVFIGGCTLAAAEQVCRSTGTGVLDTLSALVDKSFVYRFPGVTESPRFGLLETTRAFARTHLSGDREAEVRDAHADWVLDLVRQAEPHLAGGEQETWLKRLDAEHGNLLAALAWARTGGEPTVGLATAAALARYWSARGSYREGRHELEALLSHAEGASVDPSVRAETLVALGLLSFLLCDYQQASRTLEEARDRLSRLDDPARLADTLNHLSWVVGQGADLERADVLANEALAIHRHLGDARGISVALNNRGWTALYRGDAEEAEEYLSAALKARREANDDRGIAYALVNLCVLRLCLTERWEELPSWLEEAELLVERLGDRPLANWALIARGALAVSRGATEEGIALLEESEWIDRNLPHLDGRAWSLLFLGEGRRAQGNFEGARRDFGEVHESWSSLGLPWGVAQALVRLARIERDEGNVEEARRLLAESITLFESIGAEPNADLCRKSLEQIETA